MNEGKEKADASAKVFLTWNERQRREKKGSVPPSLLPLPSKERKTNHSVRIRIDRATDIANRAEETAHGAIVSPVYLNFKVRVDEELGLNIGRESKSESEDDEQDESLVTAPSCPSTKTHTNASISAGRADATIFRAAK